MPVRKHGAGGYAQGCRCETCKSGHRQKAARERAAVRDSRQAAEASLAAALSKSRGPIEAALEAELEMLESEPTFRRTLVELARINARVLDNVGAMNRPDLLSTVQARLLAVLEKLAPKQDAAPAPGLGFDIQELLKGE